MRKLIDIAASINKLIDENHIIVSSIWTGNIRVFRVATDGTRLWTIGREAPQAVACDITDTWVYDITAGQTIYGSLPVTVD